jgi:hypothetical protein
MLQNPYVLLTIDKVQNPLRLLREATSERPKVLRTPHFFCTFDFEMCFAPQRRALFGHLNFQNWSEPGVLRIFWLGNVLRATNACTFSTSHLPGFQGGCISQSVSVSDLVVTPRTIDLAMFEPFSPIIGSTSRTRSAIWSKVPWIARLPKQK